MPRKIRYESAIHQFLWAGKRLRMRLQATDPNQSAMLKAWLASLRFEYPGPDAVRVSWSVPTPGSHAIALCGARFYMRGDMASYAKLQIADGLPFTDDRVMDSNVVFFDCELRDMLAAAKVFDVAPLGSMFPCQVSTESSGHDRKQAEELFHDEWAANEDIAKINIRQRNEACTAPEMRHIRSKLGDLHGKTLLDIGCGLGEASVYFSMEGAIVTATDISSRMCETTRRLAVANGVTLETHVSAIEDLGLGTRQFDVIYAGNILHHADIVTTLDNILPHLKSDGVFVSWDPVAYNPIINLYRAIARKVRTEDEHPLRLRDIREVTSRFERSEVSWFWFSTQIIFILMFAIQFRSPNKERFWKKVIDEANAWAWLYRPFAALDRVLLSALPFLRPLCWNVVVIARYPQKER